MCNCTQLSGSAGVRLPIRLTAWPADFKKALSRATFSDGRPNKREVEAGPAFSCPLSASNNLQCREFTSGRSNKRPPRPGAAIQERDNPWKHILQKNITNTESKTATENAVGGASTWRYKKENARNVISRINAEFPLHKVTLSNSSFLLSNSNQFEKRQSTDQFHLVKRRHEVQRQLLVFHFHHHTELS